MAKLPRLCPVNIPQHIIQRGNNRQVCFNGDEDFSAYAHWLKEFADKYHVEIHARVFMTNHVHLLAAPTAPNAISLMMQSGRQYVRYYNHTYKRTGTLWEGRYKWCIVQTNESYCSGIDIECQMKILQYPAKLAHPHKYNNSFPALWLCTARCQCV